MCEFVSVLVRSVVVVRDCVSQSGIQLRNKTLYSYNPVTYCLKLSLVTKRCFSLAYAWFYLAERLALGGE